MGRPKHLLPRPDGVLWLEHAATLLRPRVSSLTICGAGAIPQSLAALSRLADAAGARGPLAGILAALRHKPDAAWLVLACDMPSVSPEALDWLLQARRDGDVAILPRLTPDARPQPLFAWYGPASRPILEERLRRGEMNLHGLAAYPGVRAPLVPEALASAWRNVNTPEELAALNHATDLSEQATGAYP
jgi:molybdopterin-guanine dinucleotide biosynthesis protein A